MCTEPKRYCRLCSYFSFFFERQVEINCAIFVHDSPVSVKLEHHRILYKPCITLTFYLTLYGTTNTYPNFLRYKLILFVLLCFKINPLKMFKIGTHSCFTVVVPAVTIKPVCFSDPTKKTLLLRNLL